VTSYDDAQVQALRREPITPEEKGFGGPLHQLPIAAAALAELRPSAREGWLGSPRAVLRASALRHNIDTMARYCADRGVLLYPHGKTTMAPQVVAHQLAAGAAGVTVATVAQARVFHRFGVARVLVANQVTDEAGALWLARVSAQEPSGTVMCYVDSVRGVELLDTAVRAAGSSGPLCVLLELGHDAGRTGARTTAEARAVAEAVGRSRGLRLAGVAGYEGSLVGPTPEQTTIAARAYCARIADLTADLMDGGHFSERPVVSAGGSAYFDAVVDVLAGDPRWQLVLRSGCYVTHDHGLYSAVSPFERAHAGLTLRPALQVWAPVLSRPTRDTVVVGAGRRDVSHDAGMPVLLTAHRAGTSLDVGGAVPSRLFDQHLVVTVPPDNDLGPGDEVELGISHPCTTFDKWRWIPVVDDDDRVVDVVRTFF
jgi:D-serine deaminase-like pyridoxal phosphate-dependent protein